MVPERLNPGYGHARNGREAESAHLECAGDTQSEEQRHEQRSGDEPGKHVTDRPHDVLASAGVYLGRVTKDKHPADYGHEHRDRHRKCLHLPIADHILADGSLAAARQSVVDSDADRNRKKQSEKGVVRNVKTRLYRRRHSQRLR